jgi:hypothetical protein
VIHAIGDAFRVISVKFIGYQHGEFGGRGVILMSETEQRRGFLRIEPNFEQEFVG